MAESTIEEITPPLPLPAIPPPAALGFTPEQYHQRLFEWLTVRDGKEPSSDFYSSLFTEFGQPTVVPPPASKPGKGKNPVNLD